MNPIPEDMNLYCAGCDADLDSVENEVIPRRGVRHVLFCKSCHARLVNVPMDDRYERLIELRKERGLPVP